jgi:hypothetical protein
MPISMLPPVQLIDPRMAELDRLIKMGRGDRTRAPWKSRKRERLEAAAAEMRAKYQPYRDAHVKAGRVSWERRRARLGQAA